MQQDKSLPVERKLVDAIVVSLPSASLSFPLLSSLLRQKELIQVEDRLTVLRAEFVEVQAVGEIFLDDSAF